jgi:tryptophan 2,3-dioxygenase
MVDDTSSDAAATLRQALQAPIYNRTLHKEVGGGQLDYEVYLRTRSLLELQTPIDQLVVPDEMLFQVLHQTQELWLKCVSFEGSNLVQALDSDEPFAAVATLDRMVVVTRCLARDIEVLFTLPPDVFQVIRRHLGNGSGLESPGYNQLLVAAEAVGEAFERKLERAGVGLRGVYDDRASHAELHRLAEQLCDWDGAFQGWLMAHFVLVRRTIGVDRSVRALDGFPTQALPARMTKPLFPRLWDLRVELTQSWTREGGFSPGESRARRGDSGVVPRHDPAEPDVAIDRNAK